ncbi:50S ribosomal protein L15 [bacterium (Candidatus Blackallbacteria) CG17_big_fil_post_rev_8_21_14_2_50_48_46]|uniref:Large ribosomal subunit protein uL15 n=1 Tax=bacterium (Candidatus Blackallbacteria) CG17_big_fil_post_rev_8_21_14_2_50_48_46 TaxID=2014261 RepID=A0A2M7G142_9BACT|nr:MAG: 50S ribosomal protein L15 [bacterium (Candidatus Blackallbacteria) CG18_big_fil_WC_8_21_14_2_50_49_26]PIW15409.1 MAG: 50S ribosomal protein L15 [bacterium (Candidatus Blackallbacteria) CG17_big_fil_post_rev_8_21_14_2_50_48_46]PIW49730.1 MAG: 50S ribosomal protein L15 [bacterium (Candidatus Blackallbacteria) CG13_big_fil_rev_8_21_14_2_50_49_14]
MKLQDLSRNTKRAKRKRVGRGMGSGMGKTSTRGHRGQGQRSGPEKKAGFEGGQMPLYRRLPKKKHFVMPYRSNWAIVNVGRLNEVFESGASVDFAALADKSLIDGRSDGLRVLGHGELSKPLNITASYVTPSAKEKIEAAGGSVQIV